MLKYLDHWTPGLYYGKPVEMLKFDDVHRIVLHTTRGGYRVKLKFRKKVLFDAALPAALTEEEAKLRAIKAVLEHMHSSAVRYAYGASNLRTLTGVSMME